MKLIGNVFILFVFIIAPLRAAEVCTINFDKYKLEAPADCVVCQNDIKIPADKVEATVNPVINFVTLTNEQKNIVRRLKVEDHFLSGKENSVRCSNYKSLVKNFSTEFQSYVTACEKGPDLIGRQKIICEYVLRQYNSKIKDTFYDYWSEPGPNGTVKFKTGRSMDDIGSLIRAQESWCRKVEKTYKHKIFLDCQDLKNWVGELDITKKVSESMKRDMQKSEEKKSTDDDRKKIFQDGCKYFDNHAATTFTQNLYLSCITN